MRPAGRVATLLSLTTAALAVALGLSGCVGEQAAPRRPQPPLPGQTHLRSGEPVGVWLTTADGRLRLSPRASVAFGPQQETPDVVVRDRERHQQFFGVGASLTGASATLLRRLPARTRTAVLRELFDRESGIGLSVLRQPMGASDFSRGTFSYDDMPPGLSDPALAQFSLGSDATRVLPLLRRAAGLNPDLAVVLSPWSAPAWMKTSGSLIGGTLRPEWTEAYARYLVRAVQEYTAAGVPVHGLTVQNEPFYSPSGYAGMTLDVPQQRAVLAAVAATLRSAGLSTHLWALDHNFSDWQRADELLSDPATKAHVYGVAFHCYSGSVSMMAELRARHPGLAVAVSECSGGRWSPGYAADLRWEAQHLAIGAVRNGAAWLVKWNLALDPSGGPTNGGCQQCTGLVTIDPATNEVTRSAAYDVWGHLGRFVTPGATVVGSEASGPLQSVAFLNPDGSHALLVLNTGLFGHEVEVGWRRQTFSRQLPAGALATFTWG